MVKKFKFIIFFISLLLLASCTSTPEIKLKKATPYERGIWHRVEEGQTLWRIAKTYGVSIDILKKENDIADVLHILPGTWLFIPGATKHLYVQGNLASSPEKDSSFKIILPVAGEIVKKFGKEKGNFNYGIDIRVRNVKNIVASQGGIVVFSSIVRGYGETIIIDHGNDFFSLYTKNIESLVHEGQKVIRNSVIAKIGQRYRADSSIVHYELFYRGKPVNPLYYIK